MDKMKEAFEATHSCIIHSCVRAVGHAEREKNVRKFEVGMKVCANRFQMEERCSSLGLAGPHFNYTSELSAAWITHHISGIVFAGGTQSALFCIFYSKGVNYLANEKIRI